VPSVSVHDDANLAETWAKDELGRMRQALLGRALAMCRSSWTNSDTRGPDASALPLTSLRK
jgi:hypothetical protein